MDDEVEVATADDPGIGSRLKQFTTNVRGLARTVPLLMGALGFALNRSHEEIKTFLTTHGTPCPEDPDSYTLGPEHHSRIRRLQRNHDAAHVGYNTLPRSMVVALVSEFDFFLGWLVRSLYLLHPELLDDSDRHLTLAQLQELGSIAKVREYLLEKEVEGLLRKSHAEHFSWLESKFGMPLRKDLAAWPTFIELTERRNLFVHADGLVSSQYLDVCRQHGVVLDPDIRVGVSLGVPPAYFTSAWRCVFEIGVKLAQVLWRKHVPEQLEAADDALIDVTYGLLEDEMFSLDAKLLDFACCTLKRFSSSRVRLLCVINRAIAYSARGMTHECEAILAAEDWSAAGEEFTLAVAVLQERYEDACAAMRRIGTGGTVSEASYKTWPLFRKFRQHDGFALTFQDVFGHPLSTVERDPSRDEAGDSGLHHLETNDNDPA